MSPEQTLSQSLRDYPPPPRVEAPIQLLQGWYYLIAGLWVAAALGSFQSPVSPVMELNHMWFVRLLGVGLALAGVGLIYASRKKESISLAIGAPLTIAVFVSVAEIIALANDLLPATFLMDTGMELGFIFWWALALYHGTILTRDSDQLFSKSAGGIEHS